MEKLLDERMMLDDIATALSLEPAWRDFHRAGPTSPTPLEVLDALNRHGLTIVRIPKVGEGNG